MRNGSVWKMPPAKVPPPVIAPRSTGLPRPVRSPVSDSPSEKAMLTPAPRAVAAPVKKAVSGRWVAKATAKMGARVDSDPSISPLSAGWTRVSRNDWLSAGSAAMGAGVMVALVVIGMLRSAGNQTPSKAHAGQGEPASPGQVIPVAQASRSEPARGGGEQAQGPGPLDGLVPPVHAQLVVYVPHVGLDGVHRQVELVGHFGRGELGGQVAQHPDLAVAERFE